MERVIPPTAAPGTAQHKAEVITHRGLQGCRWGHPTHDPGEGGCKAAEKRLKPGNIADVGDTALKLVETALCSSKAAKTAAF